MGATQLKGEQVKDGTIGIVDLSATGTPSSSTYLRGDNTWATPAGGSGGSTPITPIASDANTVYTDNTTYYGRATTANGFPVNGILTGTRIGTVGTQRLQDEVTGNTYARVWTNGTTSWTAWTLYDDSAFTSTVTAAGTTTLTNSSSDTQYFTGTTTQTVVLPAANTMVLGQEFVVINRSTGSLTVNNNSGTLILTQVPQSIVYYQVTNIGTSAGTWDVTFTPYMTGTGSLTHTFPNTSGTLLNNNDIIRDVVTADVTNSTTTAAKITDLDNTLGIGTYKFEYYIIYQSSITTTGVKFSVNHTGTIAGIVYNMRYVDVSATASTGAATQAQNATTAGVMGAYSTRLKSATANLAPTLSVDTANSNMLMIIEGLMIVSASGDIQLYHASETAAATKVMSGTSLIITKIS